MHCGLWREDPSKVMNMGKTAAVAAVDVARKPHQQRTTIKFVYFPLILWDSFNDVRWQSHLPNFLIWLWTKFSRSHSIEMMREFHLLTKCLLCKNSMISMRTLSDWWMHDACVDAAPFPIFSATNFVFGKPNPECWKITQYSSIHSSGFGRVIFFVFSFVLSDVSTAIK